MDSERGDGGGERQDVPATAQRTQRRRDVERRIQVSTLELMQAGDPAAVTVDQIAEAADVSRRTFYRYFDSSADVVASVFKGGVATWEREFRKRPLDEPLIVSFYEANLDAGRHEEQYALIQAALAILDRSGELAGKVRRAQNQFLSELYRELIVERLLARGYDERAGRPVAAALAALMTQIAADCAQEGIPLNLDRIDMALSALFTLLGETA